MVIEAHLIYISIILLLGICSIVAARFAKDAAKSNRGLRKLYDKLDSAHRRTVRRLDIYTCNVCLDRAGCKYQWNWNNTKGHCVKAMAQEVKSN